MKTDNQLVIEAKDGCNDSIIELVNRHSKLFYSICSKFSKTNSNFKYEDVISDVYYVFGECIKSYNPNKKTKFSTYLGHFSRYYCLNSISNEKAKFRSLTTNTGYLIPMEHTEIDNINNSKNNYFEEKSNDSTDYIFSLLDQMKDKRIKTIFQLRYLSGEKKESWKKIANKLNLSVTHTISLFDRGRLMILKKINSKAINDDL